LCLSQARTWISNVICHGLLCVQWVQLRWEVIVCLVDIGGIDDHHCLNFLFINLKLIWLFILCRKEKHIIVCKSYLLSIINAFCEYEWNYFSIKGYLSCLCDLSLMINLGLFGSSLKVSTPFPEKYNYDKRVNLYDKI
jgi:hypothetical protein